jgi:hypothetical protein
MLHMAEQFDAEVVDERLAEMEKVLKGGDPTLER